MYDPDVKVTVLEFSYILSCISLLAGMMVYIRLLKVFLSAISMRSRSLTQNFFANVKVFTYYMIKTIIGFNGNVMMIVVGLKFGLAPSQLRIFSVLY